MGRLLPVIVPRPDGKFNTSDDLAYLNAQETGHASFIVEGLKEGTFPVDFEITATLIGLPKGPVKIKGTASGTVLVRNPNFSINLSHPNTVRTGTNYTLFATIKNTSDVPANLVSISLDPRGVSGAELLSSSTVKVDTIQPQSSATVSFQLRSRVTGRVSATVFPTDENVVGRFILRTGVGDNNIPLSPDTLVLPDFTNNLPEPVVNSAIGFLGEAYSVATAPNGALPANIKRIKRVVVEKNALALAEAGLRVFLNEPIPNSLYNLLLDFYGSDEQDIPFDSLRRISYQASWFNNEVANIIKTEADAQGVIDFHRSFGDIVSNRKPLISVATGSGTGGAPLLMEIADSVKNRLGSSSSITDINREIPYADILNLSPETGSNNNRQMAILSSPGASGSYAINFKAIDSGSADISIIIPSGSGLKQIYYRGVSVQNGSKLSITINTAGANDFKLSVDNNGDGIQDGTIEPSGTAEIVNTGPQLISSVQVKALDKTVLDIHNRVITLLFNERITKESAEAAGNFKVDENEVLMAKLQPSGRILFLMLRDPIGPYIQRNVTVSGIKDANNASLLTVTKPIVSLIDEPGGILRGQVLSADGKPIAGAAIRLDIQDVGLFAAVSAKYTDSDGRYQYDFVKDIFRISAVDTTAGDKAQLTTSVRYPGQQINLDLIMTGKGSVTGVVKDVNGNPMASAHVQLITFTGEVKKRVIQTDGLGNFRFDNVPVGEYSLDAVIEDKLGRALGYLQKAGMTDINDIYVFAPNYGPAIEYGKVTGRVLASDGTTPVPSTPVIIYKDGKPIDWVKTDTSGVYLFGKIEAGGFTLSSFDNSTKETGNASGFVRANETASIDIVLGGLGSVSGRVYDSSGNPVSGAYVTGRLSYAITDNSGRYQLKNVPVGKNTINAVDPMTGRRGDATIDLFHSDDTAYADIYLSPVAALAGVVYNKDGITPIAGAEVRIIIYKITDVDYANGILVTQRPLQMQRANTPLPICP